MQSSQERRIRRIFTRNYGFVYVNYPAGDIIYTKLFSADSSQTPKKHLKTSAEEQEGLSKMYEVLTGVIISYWPIRMSHSDCVLIERTIERQCKLKNDAGE